MADVAEEARIRAEAKFVRAQQAAIDGEKAWADHVAEGQAVRARTERLRALRLAKEAADKEAEADAKKPATRRKKPSH